MKTTRLLAIVITLSIAFSCVATAFARSPMVRERYGDINNDDVINSTDARWLLQYCAGMEDDMFPRLRADVNADDKVNTTDARIILKVIAGIPTISCVGQLLEWEYLPDDVVLKKPILR